MIDAKPDHMKRLRIVGMMSLDVPRVADLAELFAHHSFLDHNLSDKPDCLTPARLFACLSATRAHVEACLDLPGGEGLRFATGQAFGLPPLPFGFVEPVL